MKASIGRLCYINAIYVAASMVFSRKGRLSTNDQIWSFAISIERGPFQPMLSIGIHLPRKRGGNHAS